ncbi:MAG: polyamine ABC transporter ATP-binding protein, partial [Bacteroidetes bacterium CG_4_10_14_3_um_filter_42_6]
KLGIVYQKPTLFPHMSVFENIAYPLKIKKFSKEEIKIKVKQLSEDTEITHLLKRNIGRLSGGEM